jgi:hypothetical protein
LKVLVSWSYINFLSEKSTNGMIDLVLFQSFSTIGIGKSQINTVQISLDSKLTLLKELYPSLKRLSFIDAISKELVSFFAGSITALVFSKVFCIS